MQTEHVILLNAQGVPTGTLEKYAAHTAYILSTSRVLQLAV